MGMGSVEMASPSNYPDTYRYTKQHQWVRAPGDGTALIGLTWHAQQELGDIVYVELPKPGTVLEKDAVLGSVESVKAVSDIFAPVSGEVLEVNPVLAETPERINEDPHGEAWLLKIRLADAGQLASLLSAAEYQAYASEE